MAAAPWSFGKQIREELSCSICLELFTRPKALPCQHTFCQDCLEAHAREEGAFECPTCREKITLPSQGVAGLPDNSMAASMCETFQQQATLSTKEQPQSGEKCSLHPSEEVKLYCKQCQAPVCVLCLEEAHNDHRTTTIKKAIQERSSTVQALISEGRNILEGYHSFIRGLGETEETLNKKKQQTDDSIIQTYDQMVQKLADRRDQLLSEAEKDHKKNLEKIQSGRDSVSADVNELSAACDQAEQELELGEVELLVVGQKTTLTEVVGKYRGKTAPTPVQTQPAVFQPTDTPVPVLGHVKAGDTSHHQGNQVQNIQLPDRVTFGGRGSGQGQFRDPVGVAVSEEGLIFVADSGNKRIQVFTLQGKFVRQFTTHLPSYQKMNPKDVALDGDGNPWVVGWTDSADYAVKYNREGKPKAQIQMQKMGVRGVAVDTRRNHILITQATGDGDSLQGEVLVFRTDGTLMRTVGQQQGLKDPCSITVDREGNFLVSDRGNHHVLKYNEYGHFLFQFGPLERINNRYVRGSGLKNPCGICTDRAGNIFVATTDDSYLKMFDKRGNFIEIIANDLLTQQLWAVAMATQGPLVVTDGWTDTVIIFNKP
ncbi:E3 ubiquitin-protein ligase TRIM32-like [Branchiostoma floridae x Branchiostoma belcheri]